MKFHKKVYSDIYNLRVNKRWEVEKLIIFIKRKHNLTCLKKDLRLFIQKMPFKKDYVYDEYMMRMLKRLSKSHISTKKFVEYMAKKYNHYTLITIASIHQKMSKTGIKRECFVYPYGELNRISKRDKEVIKAYNNKESYSINNLLLEQNFSTSKTIYDSLKRNGLKPRKHLEAHCIKSKTSNFSFELIDSEFKAYYVGLLLTDGYLTRTRNNVSIDLADKEVIELIAKNTGGTVKEISKKTPQCKTLFRVSIYNPIYRKQLKRLGIIDNKSLVIPKPVLKENEKKFIRYVIRGVIDGDGWIRKDGGEFFISSASKEFLEWCKEELMDLGMTNINVKFINNEYNGIYILRSALKNNISILRNEIYNAPYGMNRKYLRLHVKDVQRL